MTSRALIPAERVFHAILLVRGQKVILDEDLASLFGVETKTLNRAVKRKADRFPSDLCFRLTSRGVGLFEVCDVAVCTCFGTACGILHDCDPPEDPCPPIDPPLSVSSGLMTMAVRPSSSTSFRTGVAWMLECKTGWDIEFEGTVDFNVTNGYSNTLWSTIIADLVEDAGLCYSTNTQTHVITIRACP